MSRFRADFVDLGAIGRGGFSKVIKVIGRLDGCHYAVKRTERKLQSEREKQEALREVHIMATLGGCQEIVRYHTSWMEYDHLYIQMELCEGSLSKFIDSPSGERMDERGMLGVLRDVSAALACAHDRGVAHMDVKPDNIFILKGRYKLGDWGRVAQVNGDNRDAGVNEGDARYLSAEVLNDDFRALDRADIWSLGATLYELALATELPSHGPEYQALRRGEVQPIPDGSPRVLEFCVALMAEHPIARPSARDIHAQSLSLC
jgi:wee1-like protein kinase